MYTKGVKGQYLQQVFLDVQYRRLYLYWTSLASQTTQRGLDYKPNINLLRHAHKGTLIYTLNFPPMTNLESLVNLICTFGLWNESTKEAHTGTERKCMSETAELTTAPPL